MLLLDLAKAYDSLSRVFLLAVLRHYGFSARFCALVDSTPRNKLRFLGKWLPLRVYSRRVRYQAGKSIRQGSPLAPLLFIIALDVLYRILDASAIAGITLSTGNVEVTGGTGG